MNWRRMLMAAVLCAACYPATTRPSFLPSSAAPSVEVQLDVPAATRAVALALDADSFPVRRTEPNDGWLETGWFSASTLKSTDARPVGPDVIKLRAFVDPARPSIPRGTDQQEHSTITIETVYHPVADDSRDARELEMPVPTNHPVAARVLVVLNRLNAQFGAHDDLPATVVLDSTHRADSLPPKLRPVSKP